LEFSTAKNLGLGGSIAVVIGILLSVIPALSFLGLILVLLGVILGVTRGYTRTRSFTWPVRGV
jgi:uncharacterized membrane protein